MWQTITDGSCHCFQTFWHQQNFQLNEEEDRQHFSNKQTISHLKFHHIEKIYTVSWYDLKCGMMQRRARAHRSLWERAEACKSFQEGAVAVACMICRNVSRACKCGLILRSGLLNCSIMGYFPPHKKSRSLWIWQKIAQKAILGSRNLDLGIPIPGLPTLVGATKG